ncbi:MAG: hypothetical protein ACF8MJ_12750 [Phycisphaerales bacterium JB050]
MRQPVRSILFFLIALAFGAFLAPSLRAQPNRPVRMAPATVAANTLVSFPGQPIRVPLTMPEGFPFGEAFWVPSPMTVRLFNPNSDDDSVELVTEIIGFSAATPAQPHTQSWLPPAWNWEIRRPTEVTEAPTAPIYWMLFVRMPEHFDAPNLRDQKDGRDRAVTLQIGAERLPVRLAPVPSQLPVGRIPSLEADPDQWLALGNRLAPEAIDPTRRWRISLLLDRFPASRLFGTATLDDRFPLDDPVLRGLSTSIETEWRAALSDLADSDPDLAAALLARLTCVFFTPSGELLPAWPTDGLAESQLLPSLLSRTLSRQERVEAAQRYLDSRARIRTTVLDDAGQILDRQDSSRFRDHSEIAEQVLTSRGARLLITNLTIADRTLTLGSPGEFDSTIQRISPFHSIETAFDPVLVRLLRENEPSERQPVTGDAIVRDEGRETRVSFRVATGIVQRPGLQIGPALEPWNLATWNADSVRTTAPDLQTGLFLFRDDRDDSWKLLIEARTPNHPDHRAGEAVTLFFGPFGAPDHTLVLAAEAPQTVHRSNRWSAIVDLPTEALGRLAAEGSLALGFIRTGPGETHSSWPRPLMPGQNESGRVRLDLRGWEDAL